MTEILQPGFTNGALFATLLQKEMALFEQVMPTIYSPTCLQVGLPQYDFLHTMATSQRFHSTRRWRSVEADGANVCLAEPHALPFAEKSMSLVVLPHTLDFVSDPHQVLREVNEILTPDGCLVITGFNAHSLWGVRRILQRRRHFADSHFYTPKRVQDWLRLLSYDLIGGAMLDYTLPLENVALRQRSEFLNAAGDRWWPGFGGVYLLMGKKRTVGIRPLQVKRHPWRRLLPQIAKPVAQSQSAKVILFPNQDDPTTKS